jgi:hypothetical protein
MSNRLRRIALPLFLATLTAGLAAGRAWVAPTPRAYTVTRLPQDPVVDGRLDGEDVWRGAQPSSEDFLVLGGETPASKRTDFRAGYTGTGLFLGLRCEDPQPGTVGALVRHSAPLWEQTGIEVFLQPQGSDAYYHFLVNAESVQWDDTAGDGEAERVGDWKAAVHLGQDAWFVEVLLPWESLGRVPQEGETWRLNVCRNIQTPGGVEHVTWVPLESSFHEPRKFAEVAFAGEMPAPLRAAAEERIRKERGRREARRATGELLLYAKSLSGIYLRRGEDTKRLAFVHGEHVLPRLAPDGGQFLFHSKQKGGMGVWLARVEGGDPKRLCDGHHANWSPDGQKVVLARGGGIFERALGADKERRLSPEGLSDCKFPSYLPDGRVLFVSRAQGKDSLVVAAPDGKAAPEVLAQGEILSAPRASPDGTVVVFQSGAHLHLLTAATKAVSQLTTAGGVQSWPVWSHDGRSLCYCQSPQGTDGPWDVYNLRLAQPLETRLVVRDVEPGPDWLGNAPPTSTTVRLKGSDLQVWRLGPGASVSTLGALQKGWSVLPSDTTGRVEGGVAVRNDWGVLCLSTAASTLNLWSPPDPETAAPVELAVTDARGKPVGRLSSVEVEKRTEDSVVVKASFGGGSAATFVLSRTTPVIEVRPAEAFGRLRLRFRAKLALVPDRLADDLVLRPALCSQPTSLLPAARLVATPFGAGLLAVVTPADQQQVWLSPTRDKEAFEGMDVAPAGKSVFLAVLTEGDLWHEAAPKRDAGGDGWAVEWPDAFLAQWRLALTGKDLAYAGMWDEEATAELSDSQVTVKRLPGAPDLAVRYAYGRSWHTPLDVLALTDVLQEAVGLDAALALADAEAVRSYRSALPPGALHGLLTTQRERLWPENCRGWPEQLNFDPELMLLGWIRLAKREGVAASVGHLTGDILQSLAELDGRTKEYARFAAELDQFCWRTASPSAGARAFFAETRKRLQAVRDSVAGVSVPPLERVSASVEAIRSRFGSGSSLRDKKEYGEFCDLSRAALAGRQSVLTEYRELARSARNQAGLLAAADPATRDLCEQVRRRARDVLSNRCYLEGDWRGEKPL